MTYYQRKEKLSERKIECPYFPNEHIRVIKGDKSYCIKKHGTIHKRTLKRTGTIKKG